MRRVMVLACVLALLLAGCTKGPSRSEMEAQAAKAIGAFRDDVAVDGRLASVVVTGWVNVDTGMGFPVRLNPEADVVFGPSGEVHIQGRLADMRFEGYCHPDRIVAITENTQKYGLEDVSIESRNPIGRCTGEGSEALLTPFFEFELVDPAILTGSLYVEDMEAQGFDKSGKTLEAEYTTQGPGGTTTLFFKIRGDEVRQIVAENTESQLVMDMSFGERVAPTPPEAEVRLPTPVSGAQSVEEDGWRWRGHTREGGPIADYSLRVHDDGTSFSCTGATSQPIVIFDLADGPDQSRDGWQLILLEDGDGRLGDGDEIRIYHPAGAVQPFEYEVRIVDVWAGATAQPTCATPGPPVVPVLVVLGLVGVALRRRR